MSDEQDVVAKATAEHEWLKQTVGQWKSESKCEVAPGQAPMTMRGTEHVRMLGELWL